MTVCIQPDARSDTNAHALSDARSDAIAHALSDAGSDAGSDAIAHAEVRRSIGCYASLARLQTAFCVRVDCPFAFSPIADSFGA